MTDHPAPPRSVLVTGATGFVGSRLVEALANADMRVRALVRRTSDTSLLDALEVDRVVGSLMNVESLERAVDGVDAVVHLAALTRARGPAEYQRVNAEGTRRLVDAIRRAEPRPRRLVYLSSLAAVGPAMDGKPVGPDETPRPLTAYGRSKLEGERICMAGGEGVETIVVRAPAVYGPRDRDLFTYFQLAARGILPIPAGPERFVQLIHVADLADALIRAAMTPAAGGVYHAAEPESYGWPDVARLIARAVGRRARIVRVPTPVVRFAAATTETVAGVMGRAVIFNREKALEMLAPAWLCETDGAHRALGFRARIALPDGLDDTASWYRSQGWL